MVQKHKDKYRGIKILGMIILLVIAVPWTIQEYNYRTATPEERERIDITRAFKAAERARDAKVREDRRIAREAAERHNGDHCKTHSYAMTRTLIQAALHDPGSLDVLNWAIYPKQGNRHRLIVEFTATNGFGGRVRNVAVAYVSHETCNPVAPLSISRIR